MGSNYLAYFNQCFRIVTDSSTYEAAKTVCEEDSTTLATIKDGYEEAFVETLMYTNDLDYVWIGLTDSVSYVLSAICHRAFSNFCSLPQTPNPHPHPLTKTHETKQN